MTYFELRALGLTLSLCVMFGTMPEEQALEELRKAAYEFALDEVSR